MLLSATEVSALLSALGLTQSIFKPIPALVGGIGDTVDGLLDTVDGLGLPIPKLAPILGGILEAEPGRDSLAFSPTDFAVKDPANASCFVQPYNPPTVVAQSFAPFDQAMSNVFRYRQQQSVNLGSWFVHENWMTPSLFTCASGAKAAELDIATGWGSIENSKALLERHWDTFINQTDFEYLASIGINTVRIPIGYWSLGPSYCQGTPFEPVASVYTNAWSRVVRAINMAGEAGIGVLIDLHGAPGSQNGQAHSGTSDGAVNLFKDPVNVQKTIEVLTFLVQQLTTVTNVVGIQLLNEPVDVPELSAFYTQAITSLRQISNEAAKLPLYVHDGFDMPRFSQFVSARSDFVVEDHHSYFVFTAADDAESADQHTADVDGSISKDLAATSKNQRGNLVIGEWSCALTSDSLQNDQDALTARQLFCQGQEQVYSNNTAGWSFWSYLTEDCASNLDWCFKSAVGNTLPSTFFSYPSAPMSSPTQVMSLALAVANMDLPSITEVLDQAERPNLTAQPEASATVSFKTSEMPCATTTSAFLTSASSSEVSSPSTAANAKRSPSPQQHRFAQIHARRFSEKRMPIIDSVIGTERSITKGYSDGFLTAKIFAQYGMSKLGFTGQYVADSIATLGPSVIAPGTEVDYSDWFMKGLADGEAIVTSAAGQ